ncbi:caspase family protein [Rhizobium leguminosarum]|uniref:caspase family protein n=1 Tax=Rhizobium leguminosarum TaxID=384 RepID=UPI00103093E5|nr:caspase family protein [Rhizobium leguminosarum]TAX38953.1 caspase family protein [Rhizobium leguminosarum]
MQSSLISRRKFLAGGVLFGSLGLAAARAEVKLPFINRAAVVIGINDYQLPLVNLRAAESGASAIADFLKKEGFTVTRLLGGGVRVGDIFDAVDAFVQNGAVEQLVIYFAGHGILVGTSEYWLLSGATRNGNEAVSVKSSVDLAGNTRLVNAVFISDACRSLSPLVQVSQIHGSDIFPIGERTKHVYVDQFYAALPGQASFEAKSIDDAARDYKGFFTTAFLKAFSAPTSDMIVKLPGDIGVVPNRNLRAFLEHDVQVQAFNASITLRQLPEANIDSDLPVYIGRLQQPVSPRTLGATEFAPVSPASGVAKSLEAVGALSPGARLSIDQVVGASDAGPAQAVLLAAIKQQSDEVPMAREGVVVYGRRIKAMQVDQGGEDGIVDHPHDNGRYVAFEAPGTTVTLLLDDGTVTAQPVLRNFGTHIICTESGVSEVRFTPTTPSDLFEIYRNDAENLAVLRGLAAEATRQGVLRFEGDRDERMRSARNFAERVRVEKAVDPTLGIYAAYAYANGQLWEGVKSVAEILAENLGIELFDAAMLAGRLKPDGSSRSGLPVVPWLPMMRQGFEALRASGVTLSVRIEAGRSLLIQDPWSAFAGDNAYALIGHQGDLK